MQRRTMSYGGTLLFVGVLALAGCSGEDGAAGAPGATGPAGATGATGATGPAGQDLTATAKPESCAVCHGGAGASHQAIYNQYTDTSKLAATIESVVSTPLASDPTKFDVVVTFSLKKNGSAYATDITTLAQKTVYVTKYDSATGQFAPSTSLGKFASLGSGRYTAKNNDTPTPPALPVYAAFAPETSNAIVFAYFAENPTLITPKGSYKLYDNLASVAQAFGDAGTYASAANVAGCERCHGTPYQKHGYRVAKVAGLPDFAACKTCHYDTRTGGHQGWQLLVDDPATYAALPVDARGDKVLTDAQKAKYPYKANIMNDVHMSHAMEFAYPQTMSNCVTCHEGKLGSILTAANFKLATCKSCHPVTGVGGTDPKRAPALKDILTATATRAAIHTMDLYTYADDATGSCNGCHTDASAKKFSAIHSGSNARVYAADGTKYSSTIKATVDSMSFNSTTNILTANFSVTGASATAIIKPTVVVSLYGYDTKDFVVSGHGSQPAPDGKRNLEWAEGASGNSPRLTVTPTATAGNTTWTATADLSLWAARLADGSVKRAEVGFLPALGLDQTKAPDNTATSATYNPVIAIAGVTKTFDLVGKAMVADASSYGRNIVDAAKCNKCHEALGTTFHSPAYGSAGVQACRLCHFVGAGGSHLEMQSRSIDSYVHAIHSMQPFDIGDKDSSGVPLWDFTDPVDAMRYEHHVGSTYPNFTILNCESCHNAGTYDVPDQSRSLASILSKADTANGWDRNIGAVPSYVTGPASRACGSCHRAVMINEDKAGELAAFNEHTGTFGYMLDATTGAAAVLDAAIAKIMAVFK